MRPSQIDPSIQLINVKCTGFLHEYYSLQDHFEKKYGPKTVVLIQKGTFYETYEYLPADPRKDPPLGHAIKVSKLLPSFKLTSLNSANPHSIDNPYLLGLPKIAYNNHKQRFLDAGYTIICVDELPKKTNPVKRKIGEICTVSTNLQLSGPSNRLVCLYLNYLSGKNLDKLLITSGVSYIDNSTGDTTIYEVYSREHDQKYALYEVYRYLAQLQPVEVLIYMHNFPSNRIQQYRDYLDQQLELNQYTRVQFYYEIPAKFLKVETQELTFQKIFNDSRYLPHSPKTPSWIETLELAQLPYGRISYLLLLDYLGDHNLFLLKDLQKPRVDYLDQTRSLILVNNSLYQLNILHETGGLLDLLDQCHTEMGSRYLRARMLSPSNQVDQLNQSYHMIEQWLQIDLTPMVQLLQKLSDIEKIHRLMEIESACFKPKHLAQLLISYQQIQQLYQLVKDFQQILPSSMVYQRFDQLINRLSHMIDVDALEEVTKMNHRHGYLTCQRSFIRPGYFSEHDQLVQDWDHHHDYLTSMCRYFNTLLPKNIKNRDISIVIDTAKKDLYDESDQRLSISIQTSMTKGTKVINQSDPNKVGKLSLKKLTAATVQLVSDKIESESDALEKTHLELEHQLYLILTEVIQQIHQADFYSHIVTFVKQIDFYCNAVTMAQKYCYYRPHIVKKDISYLKVTELRHPLIERIIANQYIANDLVLGQMLLYGINSCGKSSLLKAVGVMIIMAQAGLYVPGHLEYSPYDRILTRLNGNDNLLKGQSSYIVEMEELNIILNHVDQRSLVLIDELCKGSERDSAIGLTIATLQKLTEEHASMILTSHIHELLDFDEIAGIPVKHLSVEYDRKNDQLVYGRKLLDGPIDKMYGIEVARSLGIDGEFLNNAMKIRDRVNKKSRYNSKIMVETCHLCGGRIKLETHHIEEQSQADESNMIGYYHKNSLFNLVVLCQKCHRKLHQAKKTLVKRQTLAGTQLEVS